MASHKELAHLCPVCPPLSFLPALHHTKLARLVFITQLAFAEMAREPPSLVISDTEAIGGMDGFELLSRCCDAA